MRHSNERVIKHKLGPLNLAEELGNVSIHRTSPLAAAIGTAATGKLVLKPVSRRGERS